MIASSLILFPFLAHSLCPFLDLGTLNNDTDLTLPTSTVYNEELSSLNIGDVFKDLAVLLTDSQECWPADTFGSESSYGPLFIRLAWHCAGTFREDGVGGCAGGRMRYWPEASWRDNTNLDKARALLAPIKIKYGDALSWGDLFVFAGTSAILEMGGPVTEICAGRIDSADGSDSFVLGPGPEAAPCPQDGNCSSPLGSVSIGLIYVNPAGFLGNPDPVRSAQSIREVFSRMDMNDSETVALIGGGHAFGKCHGACALGAGPSPNDDPENPWPGLCGTGKGDDTFTSGFEGEWTSEPLKWSNEFFKLLIKEEGYDYNLTTSPAGQFQWENEDGLMMLTSDLALVNDDEYKKIVQAFAEDQEVLDRAFGAVWEKLMTSGGQWATNKKCVAADELYDDDEGDGAVSYYITGTLLLILSQFIL